MFRKRGQNGLLVKIPLVKRIFVIRQQPSSQLIRQSLVYHVLLQSRDHFIISPHIWLDEVDDHGDNYQHIRAKYSSENDDDSVEYFLYQSDVSVHSDTRPAKQTHRLQEAFQVFGVQRRVPVDFRVVSPRFPLHSDDFDEIWDEVHPTRPPVHEVNRQHAQADYGIRAFSVLEEISDFFHIAQHGAQPNESEATFKHHQHLAFCTYLKIKPRGYTREEIHQEVRLQVMGHDFSPIQHNFPRLVVDITQKKAQNHVNEAYARAHTRGYHPLYEYFGGYPAYRLENEQHLPYDHHDHFSVHAENTERVDDVCALEFDVSFAFEQHTSVAPEIQMRQGVLLRDQEDFPELAYPVSPFTRLGRHSRKLAF